MAGRVIVLYLQKAYRALEHCVIQQGDRLLAAQVAVEAVSRMQLLLEGVQVPLSHALIHLAWVLVGLTSEMVGSFLLGYFLERLKEIQGRVFFFGFEE